MKTLLITLAVSLALGTAAGAQQRPTPAPVTPAPPAAPAPPAQPERPTGLVQDQPTPPSDQPNIRFDIAIADDGAGAPPVRKNLVVMVQGMGKASLRSQGVTEADPVTKMARRPLFLNVDVNVAGWGASEPNKVRTRIMVEYTPYMPNSPMIPASVKAQVDVSLDHGKKVLIWQTADPFSDRQTRIEVTATVIR